MANKYIYRVENKEGDGPYRFRNKEEKLIDHPAIMKMYDYVKCPTPSIEMVGSVEVFGFESLEQYRQWFDVAVLRLFRQFEFKLSVYEIDEQYITRHACQRQISFDPRQATLVEKHDLFDAIKLIKMLDNEKRAVL